MTVTIYDVAREARVSMATVSRVVNGNQNVKPETRKKVNDVIQRLKYYGSKVFDTQDNGELTINLDEEVYIVYRDILNQKSLARESVS